MRRIGSFFISVLCILALCSCGDKNSITRWQWTSAEVTAPDSFGNILGLTKANNDIFVASYSSLGRYKDGVITFLDTIYSREEPAIIYGITSYGDTLYLLTGEMRPQYTDNGEVRENPDFSGQYTLISYHNGLRAESFPFQLSKNDCLSGLLALSDEYILSWTSTNVWVVSLKDGNVYPQQVTGEIIAPATSQSGMWMWAKQEDTFGYYPLSAQQDAMGEYITSEGCPSNCAASISDNAGCLLNTGATFSLYDVKSETSVELTNWHECALAEAMVTSIVQLDTDTWVCASYLDGKLWQLHRQELENAKNTIHIAAAFGSAELDNLVTQFEKMHKDCAVVVDYYPDNAYDRLCTEIMAGDGPDVLNLYGLSLPVDSPYLEDLYTYMDNDADLNRSDFVPTVLSSLDVNGTLRSIPATYDIVTLSARASDVSDRTRWTFEEMRSILAQRPQLHLLPKEWTRTEFLKWIASISTGEYIDWATHTSSYDSENFQEYLRFCESLPETMTGQTEDSVWNYLTHLDIIQNAASLQQLAELWDEPFTLVGFPTGSGSGSFIECTTLHLGISSNSQKKDLAWAFIKLALSQENQQRLAERMYSPVRKDVMEAQINATVSDDAAQKQYLQLISQPLVFIGYNEDVAQIVLDEGTAYFEGKYTVYEAAERIQNRVTIYLSEIG